MEKKINKGSVSMKDFEGVKRNEIRDDNTVKTVNRVLDVLKKEISESETKDKE